VQENPVADPETAKFLLENEDFQQENPVRQHENGGFLNETAEFLLENQASRQETGAWQEAPGDLRRAAAQPIRPTAPRPPGAPTGQRFPERFGVDGIRCCPYSRSRHEKNQEPIQCFGPII